MKKTLYLMRHGQTLFNVQHKIQGWCDSPLSDLGKRQAQMARQYFEEKNIIFDHVYSSTSERCCDTLEIITKQPYIRLKELKEMFYGELEGESERLNSHLSPKDCESFYLQYGGESSNNVKNRMTKTLINIMNREDHYHVLVMSHGGSCFNFLRGIQDPTDELNKGFGNCCIFIFEFDENKFQLKEVIRQEGVE